MKRLFPVIAILAFAALWTASALVRADKEEPKVVVKEVPAVVAKFPPQIAEERFVVNAIPMYPVRFVATAIGSDGSHGMVRDGHIPFVPKIGDTIDIFTAEHVSYSTRAKSFIVSFAVKSKTEKVSEIIKALLPDSQGWKSLAGIETDN